MKNSILAEGLIGSEILKIAGEVNSMIKNGEQVSNLTVGDFNSNYYPIPATLKKYINEAYQDNQTNYPPSDGILELRESVSNFLSARLNLSYDVTEILIAGGSRPLIYATYLAIVDKGDKVIYPIPSWNNNHYCYLTGADGIAVATTASNNFLPTAAALEPHLKDAVLLALCSPLNPTGTMFQEEELRKICELVLAENKRRSANEKPLYIMYDHIYWLLTFGNNKHVDPVSMFPELKEYTIYIDGASKYLASTGVRVGWGFGPKNIMDKMKSILGHIGAWAPKAEQVAMAKYLNDKEDLNAYLVANELKLKKSLDALYAGIQALKKEGFKVDAIAPAGAIYLTIQIDYLNATTADGTVLKNSMDINSYLIKEAKLALVPFNAFGTTNMISWFRASVGACTVEDIERGITNLRDALSKLTI
ncbi:MAG: aminotransferase class I/II-fold pyridoxal phosphate-dependent enzyme [Bacteroidota bacterium]